MIMKIHSCEEEQKLFSNRLNAVRGQRNQHKVSKQIRINDKKPEPGGKQKNDEKVLKTNDDHRSYKAGRAYDNGKKRNPVQDPKVWKPVEIGDNRIPGVGRLGSLQCATSDACLSERSDVTSLYLYRS